MKPGAQVAAAIDLMTLIYSAWQESSRAPADSLIAAYFKERRYIGSKDRGAISSLVYGVLRQGAALEWRMEKAGMAVDPRALVLGALVLLEGQNLETLGEWLNGERHCAAPLRESERQALTALVGQPLLIEGMPLAARYNFPDWMEASLRASLEDQFDAAMLSMMKEAPVDLRVNTLKTSRDVLVKQLHAAGYEPQMIDFQPNGIRLKKRGPMFTLPAFREGAFEMQDAGSQLAASLVAAKPGDKVIDFCAGAGGKTLAIAATMQNRGRLLAWDVNSKRLAQMPKRLSRAGVHNVQIRVLASENDAFVKRHKQSADWVLIDAPCTGSGTWRRNPDLKWRTTAKDLAELEIVQGNILASAARLVKPGGHLVYVTCSMFDEENRHQAQKFLERQKDFSLAPMPVSIQALTGDAEFLRLWPHRHETDGFFAAMFQRQA
ncbi:MAG: RsmB/NOP family class I SAM-dependent RNA methyltransferase [Rickettsiales bacterium]|nr:RsmB/NOP family class I SAM-dependent RNA methyltransferase [Rickettsiales bacterium]